MPPWDSPLASSPLLTSSPLSAPPRSASRHNLQRSDSDRTRLGRGTAWTEHGPNATADRITTAELDQSETIKLRTLERSQSNVSRVNIVRGDDESRHPLTAQGGAHTVAVKQDTQLDSDRANATLLHASAVSTESLTAFTPGILQIRIDGPPLPKLAPAEQPIRDESSLSVADPPTRRIGTDLPVKNGSPKASSVSLSQTQTTGPSETSAAAGSLLPLRRESNSTLSTSGSAFDDARVTELKHQLLQSNNLAAKLSQSVRDHVKEIGWSGAMPFLSLTGDSLCGLILRHQVNCRKSFHL